MNTRNIARNTVLIISSLVFTALLIIVGEAVVRLTMDLPSLGNSANLFTPNAFGASMGNARNTEAISFGVKVYTDADGFRVGKHQYRNDRQQHNRAVLVLGDSVGFGPGVEFPETFVGRLTAEDTQLRVYNTSVIGYAVEDYKNVANAFLPAHSDEINAVFLIFCLNDISTLSATNIDRTLTRKNTDRVEAEQITARPLTQSYRNTIVDKLKHWPLVSRANEYLRSRSKLYVLLKGLITDPQARYWQADLQAYRRLTMEELTSALRPLRYIADVCLQYKILFTVVVVPYEYQVRVDDESTRLPQQMLGKFFETSQIPYVDALPLFRQRSADSADFFLRYDPMHLSPQGHDVLHEIIAGVLTQAEVDTGDNS